MSGEIVANESRRVDFRSRWVRLSKGSGHEVEMRGLDLSERVARCGRKASGFMDAREVMEFEARVREVRFGVGSGVVIAVISLQAALSEIRDGKLLVRSTI